jgi:hypoxanthine phosphoribosyltransferase
VFKRKYVFLSPREVDVLVDSIIDQVRESGYTPEIIISIMRGGAYPGKRIAARLMVAWGAVNIQHYSLPLMGVNMVYFPGVVMVLQRLGRMGRARMTSQPNLEIHGKRVLLVDDDIENGETMKLALDILSTEGPDEIRTAVLSLNERQYQADFYPQGLFGLSDEVRSTRARFGSLIRFKWPWEPLSPYFESTQERAG